MLPDWTTIQASWPIMVALAAVWARVEVALSRSKDQSKANGQEILKVERKFDTAIAEIRADAKASASAQQAQAIQLSRIEESLTGFGRTLERIDRSIEGMSKSNQK